MTFFACGEFGWTREEVVWNTPLLFLMLMMRQKVHQHNPDGITLEDKELIDRMSSRN